MAVDEWLLETACVPVLRVYRWAGEWASIGYFGAMADARATFPGVGVVRRWTGGGMVDHRADWTYTFVIPTAEKLAASRGADSYRLIHEKLAKSLYEEGIVSRLSHGHEETGAALCFANPVTHDLLDANGAKLAGAG
ncbi:MAG: lipoate--protein ligase family protein, partial [Verrucomicrobiaceae bacterium]